MFSETLSTFHWQEHEIEAAKTRITLEALRAEASARNIAMEAIHREVFGFHGLGSSLLCQSWRPSELTQEKLSFFKKEAFEHTVSGPLYSLTSFGVDLDCVKALDSTYFTSSMKEFVSQRPADAKRRVFSQPTNLSSARTLHLERGVNDTVLSVAFLAPGFGGKSISENLKLLILKEAFYAPSPIPYGAPHGKWMGKSHLNGATMQFIPEFFQYSDAGLFGFTISLPVCTNIFSPEKVLIETAQPLVQEKLLLDISEAQFKAAKAAAKLRIAEYPEHAKSFAIGIGKFLFGSDDSVTAMASSLPSVAEMMQSIDSTEIGSIRELQKSIFSKHPACVIVGPTLSGAPLKP
ncbi:hypothetical protein DI09_100p110 [Mitosporidium daphniae]|uniref:Uncharacterized protein n=1 Tax=Mitosporidium daphniae TaxID=1485682 RepID=A0A098VWD5_9MICR|nr:uncharacterized protein DI09_100p110 [Mitosporidium daphniae]KGG53247.1 hypothetical protein DI09_100p110 [Mitosporidium daphniae]|eukprot:XP_013239683.1 uncharacterized protein DI09_100p110 [Mitosporidium daphniae]